MDPTVLRAVQRAVVAFVVTFIVGSGLVFAIDAAGGDGATDTASPSPTTAENEGDGDGSAAATTPEAYLVWMAGGFPARAETELATLERVRNAAVATAGVGWLESSLDDDGEVVDAPEPPSAIPVEVTGVVPRAFASFLPEGDTRDVIEELGLDQAVLSASSAKFRGLGVGATLQFDNGDDLEVVAVVPDVLIGGYEVLMSRRAAEKLGARIPRYALLRLNRNATPSVQRLTAAVAALVEREVRDPAIEVRRPGDTELLRAHDRSPTPIDLKRRFGEFRAIPGEDDGAIVIDADWIAENIDTREVPRLGLVTCHRKMLAVLRKAMSEVTSDADLGDIGECFSESWAPDMPQGTLPASLWGASIRVNVSLNRPGNPPFLDQRIVETMQAWGFRWGGEDAYPDGGLFELVQPRTDAGEG